MRALLLPELETAALLLVFSGLAKLRDPAGARTVLGLLGLPARAVSLVAVAELAVGGLVVAEPGRVSAAALAAVFLLFAAVIERLRRDAPGLASCGCLGSGSAAPSRMHSVLDLAFASAAGAAAVWPLPHPWTVVDARPGVGAVAAVGVVTAAALAAAWIDRLPTLMSAYGRGAA